MIYHCKEYENPYRTMLSTQDEIRRKKPIKGTNAEEKTKEGTKNRPMRFGLLSTILKCFATVYILLYFSGQDANISYFIKGVQKPSSIKIKIQFHYKCYAIQSS